MNGAQKSNFLKLAKFYRYLLAVWQLLCTQSFINSHISRAVERFGRTEKLESHMVEVSFQQIPARTDSIPFSIFPQVLPTWISFSRTSLTEAEHCPISFQGGV